MTIKIVKNDKREIVEIEGIKYAYDFFSKFAREIPINTLMVITHRDDGVITVAEVEPGDVFKMKNGMPYKMPLYEAPEHPAALITPPRKTRMSAWKSTLEFFRRIVW